MLRFLLKSVQNVHHLAEPDRINRPVSIPVVIFNHLKDASSAEALERFGGAMLAAQLRDIQRKPASRTTSSGKARRSSLALPIQPSGFIESAPAGVGAGKRQRII